MKSLIVIILDESGSMFAKKADVIGGFNEFLSGQKQITTDSASVIFLKFNSVVSIVHDVAPIAEISELTETNFKPGGSTALYDAIWDGVRLAEKVEVGFDRVLCLVMTDGEENASRKITGRGVIELIQTKEGEGKWTFLYLGENPERWAKTTGIDPGNVSVYEHAEPRRTFRSATVAVSTYRSAPSIQQFCLLSSTNGSAGDPSPPPPNPSSPPGSISPPPPYSQI